MIGWLVLAAAGAGLVVFAVVSAGPPGSALDRDGYVDRWQALHGGYDPRTRSTLVHRWLIAVHALGRPLARRGVHPDLITAASLWFGLLVVLLADTGGRWAVAAAAALVGSAVLDGVDGCVAVLEQRTTAWGYVLDSVVDRANEALFLVALVVLGCPVWLAVGSGFVCFLLEYLRARSGNAGGDEVVLVTVAERPTRVIVLAAGLLLAGAQPGAADVMTGVGAAVLLAVTAVALGQLAAAVRAQLIDLPQP